MFCVHPKAQVCLGSPSVKIFIPHLPQLLDKNHIPWQSIQRYFVIWSLAIFSALSIASSLWTFIPLHGSLYGLLCFIHIPLNMTICLLELHFFPLFLWKMPTFPPRLTLKLPYCIGDGDYFPHFFKSQESILGLV